MTKRDKTAIYILLVFIISFLLTLFSLATHINKIDDIYETKKKTEENVVYHYPYFSDHKDIYIKNYINSLDTEYADNISYVVSFLDDFVVIFFKLYKEDMIVDYKNMIFYNDEIVDVYNIITDREKLEKKILEVSNTKKFNLTEKEINKAVKSFLFKDYEVDIYLSNYNNKGSISLVTIKYIDISDYLNIYHKTDKSEEVETVITEEVTTTKKEYDKNKPAIAFTFDDGPSFYTLQVADVLEAYGANATFFMVGTNIKNHNNVVHELHDRGFELGNHTTDHSQLTRYSCESIKTKVHGVNDLIKGIVNEDINLIRPPYGSVNEKVKSCIDMSFILWDVDSRDWESRNKNKIYGEVMPNIKDGSIVLFHDLYESTLESVKEIIPLLIEGGYQIVSVSELFELKEYKLENNTVYRSARK